MIYHPLNPHTYLRDIALSCGNPCYFFTVMTPRVLMTVIFYMLLLATMEELTSAAGKAAKASGDGLSKATSLFRRKGDPKEDTSA